jgi:hypothetical protein
LTLFRVIDRVVSIEGFAGKSFEKLIDKKLEA